jgi:hypothetical protein
MFDIPDRLQVIYEEKNILDTDFVSGSNSIDLNFGGSSGKMVVKVIGNQNTDTLWEYVLSCPI